MIPMRPNPPFQAYAVLLVGVSAPLEVRLSAALTGVARLERVAQVDEAPVVLMRTPVGLIVVEVAGGKSSEECALRFARLGVTLPLLLLGPRERITWMPGGASQSGEGKSRCLWEDLPELIIGQLHLATIRLDALLLRDTLETVLNNVREGVILVDQQMMVHGVNPAALRACHFVGSALGHSLFVQKGGCVPDLAALLQRVMTSRKAELNVHLNCAPSPEERTEIRVTATPLIDHQGHCFGGVVVIMDRASMAEFPEDVRSKRQTYHRLIGASPRMQEVYDLIESLANMDTTTLITGESGVGKELVAEALHFKGRRGHGPLIKVNCSALQDTLLESELFGHVKGAFTGAVRDRPGRFESATGGTIFLDEIGDISHSMQTRLLRVLQEKELERVGDSRTIRVDVRVVAATNRDLAEQIRLGRFREDLYFRLNVVEIAMPPLRKRLEDLPLLINHFIQKFNSKYDKNIIGVQDGVLDLFRQYPWPGNIRELENAIEHAFVVCRMNMIRIRHLPKNLVVQRPCADPAELCAEELEEESQEEEAPITPVVAPMAMEPPRTEKDALLRALEEAQWHKKKAAKLLGISRSTFYRKLEKFGIG
ncbi:MAG: sigma 54-interacting transcriptional regulator [Magnetococcales bacterium]|nr:sigma 54-interacting transcriptional regulator [Magnetococcales bacterium]